MRLVERLHAWMVYGRRVRVLADVLAPLLPAGRILDVGTGDGSVARSIADRRPDLEIEGVNVLVRPETHVPVHEFDGRTLPFPDASYEATLLVDVLHHADDPEALLHEAARVARTCVVVKDHAPEGRWPRPRCAGWTGWGVPATASLFSTVNCAGHSGARRSPAWVDV